MTQHGHDGMQLPNYTQRQLLLYYDELIKQQNRAKADQIENIYLGFNGGKKINTFVKQLRGEQ